MNNMGVTSATTHLLFIIVSPFFRPYLLHPRHTNCPFTVHEQFAHTMISKTRNRKRKRDAELIYSRLKKRDVFPDL